jgi:hypothetical protein
MSTMPSSSSRGATATALAGAIAAAALVLWTGRHNRSALLVAMFVVWDVLPFAMLVVLLRRSVYWRSPVRAVLPMVTLLITLLSLAIYALVAFGPPRPQPAFFFLIVPPASMLAALVLIGAAAIVTRSPDSV